MRYFSNFLLLVLLFISLAPEVYAQNNPEKVSNLRNSGLLFLQHLKQ